MRIYGTLCILGIFLCSTFASAFDSRGPNIGGISLGESIHEEITEKALKEKGFSHSVIEKIEDANTDVDWDETSFSLWKFKLVVNEKYRPYHHFDRLPGITHKQAFRDGANYVKQEIENVVNAILNGDKEKAMEAMGKGLHALQDFFAHSNFVDLSDKDKDKVWKALFDPDKGIPSSLKLTGYDPKSSTPGKPENDEYPHDDYAKDSPNFNKECSKKLPNGKTKFKEAYDSAVEATGKFIDKFEEMLKEKLREKLKKEGREDKLEEELKKLLDNLKNEREAMLQPTYDKLMAMAIRYYPLIEEESKEEILASFVSLANDFLNGVSPEYPFGRNEIFSLKISDAINIAQSYIEKDDFYNASQLANLSIEYANKVLSDAEEKGIEVSNITKIVNEAEALYEYGDYLEAMKKIASIEFPFNEIYPEFQNSSKFALYVLSAKANGKFLEECISLKWENYQQRLKIGEPMLLFAPSGNYSAELPIDIKIFGIKIAKIDMAKTEGSIDNEGIVYIDLVISTYFIPYSIIKFLIQHFISMLIILILVGAILKLRKKDN